MIECNNISNTHEPMVISEDQNAMRVGCKICHNQYVLRKDWRGVLENRQYSKIFKRDVLQGNENLFYKYNERFLKK